MDVHRGSGGTNSAVLDVNVDTPGVVSFRGGCVSLPAAGR